MIIKKYLVSNMNEGLARIRYELGKDAIIISQRKVKQAGIKGWFSKKIIEITAAIENSRDEEKAQTKKDQEFKDSLESIKRLMQQEIAIKKDTENSLSGINNKILEHNANVEKEMAKEQDTLNNKMADEFSGAKINNHTKNVMAESKNNIDSVQDEVRELKDLINKVIENTSTGESLESLLQKKLKKIDIDEEFHEDIIKSIKENLDKNISEDEALREIFEKDILVSKKQMNGRIVLVGPTGVGKTTTIAKLAGKFALIEKKKVGLITVDTYRIGAIEQLKTYAEIMNIPFRVVITMKEMEEAIEFMQDCDVVLIDTTGRSSKNAMQISELRAFVQKANPQHINMVISSITKNKDIKSVLNGYSELDYDSVIVTKLDETTAYGSLYNIARMSNKPINFITTGQNVPDDIKTPTKEEIASFILGEETLC